MMRSTSHPNNMKHRVLPPSQHSNTVTAILPSLLSALEATPCSTNIGEYLAEAFVNLHSLFSQISTSTTNYSNLKVVNGCLSEAVKALTMYTGKQQDPHVDIELSNLAGACRGLVDCIRFWKPEGPNLINSSPEFIALDQDTLPKDVSSCIRSMKVACTGIYRVLDPEDWRSSEALKIRMAVANHGAVQIDGDCCTDNEGVTVELDITGAEFYVRGDLMKGNRLSASDLNASASAASTLMASNGATSTSTGSAAGPAMKPKKALPRSNAQALPPALESAGAS
ncbi:hypothetical protein BDV98DRAFT_572086, partial [Pterulicium gracile]